MAIPSALIKTVTATLYEAALKRVPEDTKAALRAAPQRETNPAARNTLTIMLKSATAAQDNNFLVCTDVGIPVYVIRIGTGVSFAGNVRQAITEGFAELVETIQPPILPMITHPLTRERGFAGKNIPIVTFDLVDDADYIDITCSPKALGTGRWAALEIFTFPTLETIENFILEAVLRAGSQPCPPIVVGVGIGGTFDYATKMAKEGMLRPIGSAHPDPAVAAMEQRLLNAINKTGFGPMGTGGDTTAMGVHIDYSAGHGFTPVAVCFNCWINRRTRARIYNDGRVEYHLE